MKVLSLSCLLVILLMSCGNKLDECKEQVAIMTTAAQEDSLHIDELIYTVNEYDTLLLQLEAEYESDNLLLAEKLRAANRELRAMSNDINALKQERDYLFNNIDTISSDSLKVYLIQYFAKYK